MLKPIRDTTMKVFKALAVLVMTLMSSSALADANAAYGAAATTRRGAATSPPPGQPTGTPSSGAGNAAPAQLPGNGGQGAAGGKGTGSSNPTGSGPAEAAISTSRSNIKKPQQ